MITFRVTRVEKKTIVVVGGKRTLRLRLSLEPPLRCGTRLVMISVVMMISLLLHHLPRVSSARGRRF